MGTSRLDSLYRRLLLTGFFTKGWGEPHHMRHIFALRRQAADRDVAQTYVCPDRHRQLKVEQEQVSGKVRRTHFSFESPAVGVLDDALLPDKCRTAHFELVESTNVGDEAGRPIKPVCLQYAGTGDHFFWRRRTLSALPMLEERGVTSVIIENPFYGLRKPPEQLRSSLRNVTDIFVMGACLMMESLVIQRWLRQERGFVGPMVFHGVSMGGHMAALSATVSPEPVGVVPCLAWTSASLTFTEGVMSGAINWPLLESQLLRTREYRQDILAMCRSERNAFQEGMDFAQTVMLAHASEDVDREEQEAKAEVNGPSTAESSSGGTFGGSWTSNTFSSIYGSLDSILSALNLPLGQLRKSNSDKEKAEELRQEAFHFMRGIMDECTHLKNFAVPVDPSLCVAIAAEKDAYQPRDGVRPIDEVWPGAELRYLEGEGHISSFLFKQRIFREAIYEVLDRMMHKYRYGSSS